MLHVVPYIWGMLLGCGLQFVKGHITCNLVKSKTPFVHKLMELPNTSLLVILSLAQLFGASLIQHAWHWYWMYSHSASGLLCNLSNKKYGCLVWQGYFIDSVQLTQIRIYILVSLGKHLRTHLKDHTTYGQGPGIHSKPRKVLLLVSEAHLAGCLKVCVGVLLEGYAGI